MGQNKKLVKLSIGPTAEGDGIHLGISNANSASALSQIKPA